MFRALGKGDKGRLFARKKRIISAKLRKITGKDKLSKLPQKRIFLPQ
uniref:Uncharacterized protein n=1 Tax=Anguilla anguilla TaxID=7936 RepID=A0A0E9PX53_ANGAN